MLGNLAKKLRMLGYDTEYHSSIDDEKLITLARQEDRILLTKDVILASNANKNVQSLLIKGNDDLDQLVQIFGFLGIGNIPISTDLAYCISCNGKLVSIEKNLIRDKVPDGVYHMQQNFWICDNCRKIFWEGTHFKKIQEFVSKLNNRLS